MTQRQHAPFSLRMCAATRAVDVPDDAKPFVVVDGTVEGFAVRFDHHVTEELTNLGALPDRFEPGALRGIVTPWVDVDAVVSAAVLLAGGRHAVSPAHWEELESAAYWCDHLGPHPELAPCDNDAGRALYDALGSTIAHAPPGTSSEVFARLAHDLAQRLLDGAPLPAADTREAQSQLAAALRQSGRVRVVARPQHTVALVDLTGHPPIAPVALYDVVQADIVLRYETLPEGGYRYTLGAHPSAETPPDLRPVLRALAEREFRSGPPARAPDLEPASENWGGRAAAGGSPRNYGSRIAPDDALSVVLMATGAQHRVFTEALRAPGADTMARAREKMLGVLRRKLALKSLSPESLGYRSRAMAGDAEGPQHDADSHTTASGSGRSHWSRDDLDALTADALSWSMTGGCRLPTAEEIADEARVPAILLRALAGEDIDGLVLTNVEHFLARRVREADPEAYRVFKVVESTLQWACAQGLLQAIGLRRQGRQDSTGAIRNETTLFAPHSANLPLEEGRAVAFWLDHLATIAPGWKGLCVRIRDSFSERARARFALRIVQIVGLRYRFRVDALVEAVLQEVRNTPVMVDRDPLVCRLEDVLDEATRPPAPSLVRCDALARAGLERLALAPESELCRADDEDDAPSLPRPGLERWKELVGTGDPTLPTRIRRRLDAGASQRVVALVVQSLHARPAVAVVGFVVHAFADLSGERPSRELSALDAMATIFKRCPMAERAVVTRHVASAILRRGGKRGRPERLRALWRALTRLWSGEDTATVVLKEGRTVTLDAELIEGQDVLGEVLGMPKQTLSDDLVVLREMLIEGVRATLPAAGLDSDETGGHHA